MNRQPKVFFVILNFNGKDSLKSCLSSVFNSNYPNFEVVLVDNNSDDGSLEMAKSCFEKAHIIKNGSNLGFSSGNNVGIRFALEKMADYVFLLNNDATIERDALSKLLEVAEENREAGLLSPIIRNGYRPDEIWFCGGKIQWSRMRTLHDCKHENVKSGIPYESEYLSGCALLIRKEVFREIGLFDEDFFLYYEDADFSYRAGLKNFKKLIVPSASASHLEKSNRNGKAKTYWLVISGMIFFHKNSPWNYRLWMKIYQFLRKIKNLIDSGIRHRPMSEEVRKAHIDFKRWKLNRSYQS